HGHIWCRSDRCDEYDAPVVAAASYAPDVSVTQRRGARRAGPVATGDVCRQIGLRNSPLGGFAAAGYQGSKARSVLAAMASARASSGSCLRAAIAGNTLGTM